MEIEKLNSMADENFYKISLNGVYVTADSIIGDVGSGWSTITKALALERTGHDYYIKAQKSFNAFKQYIEETNLLNINDYATELNKLSSKLEVAKLMSYRVLKQIDNMKIDEEKATISKWYASELACEITNKAVEIIGVSELYKVYG
ncbi:acyl-CoA dehydrogenase family protein [Bacillus megaterium]|nr:acyl-CoA dehydrogenase family protein [Priestia megaterium]